MYAAQWSEQEKACEVRMIHMTTAVVDPGTMMIHLHHTPEGRSHFYVKYDFFDI